MHTHFLLITMIICLTVYDFYIFKMNSVTKEGYQHGLPAWVTSMGYQHGLPAWVSKAFMHCVTSRLYVINRRTKLTPPMHAVSSHIVYIYMIYVTNLITLIVLIFLF